MILAFITELLTQKSLRSRGEIVTVRGLSGRTAHCCDWPAWSSTQHPAEGKQRWGRLQGYDGTV